MALSHGWQVGAGCQLGAQPGARARDSGSSSCGLNFLTVRCPSSVGETPNGESQVETVLTFRTSAQKLLLLYAKIYLHSKGGDEEGARFWKRTWDGKYCCSHLGKTQSATSYMETL